MFKKNDGITLITLIVTIISIIILAAIIISAGYNAPNNAMFSDFSDEMSNMRVAVNTFRAQNLAKYDDENYNFKQIKLKDAPNDFVSFSGDMEYKVGYAIDCDLLNYVPEFRGKADNLTEATFGKDDVYVYDKKGTIYYVKGQVKEDTNRIYYNNRVFEELGGK